MLMLFLSVPAYSQVVKGKVLDKNSNEPIIGASVQVKGTNIGTMTDIEGEFELNVKNGNATLQVSYIGYTTAVQPLEGKTSITILLKESITELEDVVVIGYGVQKKSDLTGAIASVNAEDIASLPATNVMHAIQGKAAGVEIVQNSGAPGASSTVRI
ncbi:MAG: carboxypeptidase-like regulatory domain-containing protein, partial [Muribaculaceae bacterium]